MEYVNKTAATWRGGTHPFNPLSRKAFAEFGIQQWVYLKHVSEGWEIRSANGHFLEFFRTYKIAASASYANNLEPLNIH